MQWHLVAPISDLSEIAGMNTVFLSPMSGSQLSHGGKMRLYSNADQSTHAVMSPTSNC